MLFLVEISSGAIHRVKLDASNASTGSSRGRMVMYIPGSPYLWVTAKASVEASDHFSYVVQLDMVNWDNSKVLRKVTGISTNGMIFVENMKLVGDLEAMEELDELKANIQQLQSQLKANTVMNGKATSSKDINSSNNEKESSSSNALNVVSIVIAVVALTAAMVGLVYKRKPFSAYPSKSDTNVVDILKEDELSMESKNRENML